jgi:hypothetical protein
MSFTAKVQSSRNELIWRVTGKDKGRDCWYYIQLEKSKLEMFKAKLKTDSFELTDYGKILYSGWGAEPPENIKQKIQEQFG